MPDYNLTAIKKKYKSPIGKLTVFFKLSRDKWKAKTKKSKKIIKRLKNRIKYLNKTKNELKKEVKELKAEIARLRMEDKEKERETCKPKQPADSEIDNMAGNELLSIVPFYHSYTLGHIILFLLLTLSSATSLRGASRCMEIVFTFFGFQLPVPSWTAGRLWLLRVGYYKLTRAKEIADDWVWIADHTIQIGIEKCFVILGIRLKDLPAPGTCISHNDVDIIDMIPVKHSNGRIVYEQLTGAIAKTGAPREIIGDNGPDLKAGVQKFCEENEGTCFIYDIKHKTAAVLKRILAKDEKWSEFASFAGRAKVRVQQTPLAPLSPPNQRSKARYMNVDKLVRWGIGALKLYDSCNAKSDGKYDLEKLDEKLGPITEYREELNEWGEVIQVAETAERFVREQGISRDCHKELLNQPKMDVTTEKALDIKNELAEFVESESLKADDDERLLGSSEIIESVFGKLKFLEKDQAKSGLTGLLLSVGAFVSETSNQAVQKAIETVRTADVSKWCEKMIGQTVQSKRKEAFNPP